MKNFLFCIFSILLFVSCASSPENVIVSGQNAYQYHHRQLATYNLEQMRAIQNKYILQSRKTIREADESQGDEPEVIENLAADQLMQALEILLSRPDADNMISKLLPDLRTEMQSLGAFHSRIQQTVEKALQNVKNPGRPLLDRATAVYIVENAMSQAHPFMRTSEPAKKILLTVKNSKVKIPKAVAKELRINALQIRKPKHLTKMAERFLKN